MNEKDEIFSSFFFPFMSGIFPDFALTEQPGSLVPNGMHRCDCATYDKCQQLGCVFVNQLPEDLI